jgi:putative glycosyltransferase (TIGR04348 family)
MKILIVTPAPHKSRKGNRVTARRWASILRRLGHQVTVGQQYVDEACDLLVALHAAHSFRSVIAARRRNPGVPVIVAIAGTDLYGENGRSLPHSRRVAKALQAATRVIVLQPDALAHLPAGVQAKTRVIHQSAARPARLPKKLANVFEVAVVGHLRPVKDPFRAALAARRLPADSKIRIIHFGAALTESMKQTTLAEQQRNLRYRWQGDRPRWLARRRLARSRLLVHSSRTEGGANVVSEAIAAGVPILASYISGNVGMLGADYPGYFPLGDTAALACALRRCETDSAFYRRLKSHIRRLAPLVKPSRECRAWRDLLEEICR